MPCSEPKLANRVLLSDEEFFCESNGVIKMNGGHFVAWTLRRRTFRPGHFVAWTIRRRTLRCRHFVPRIFGPPRLYKRDIFNNEYE